MSRATENVLRNGVDHIGDNLFQPEDMLLDATLAPIMFKVTGGSFKEIAGINLTKAGPYANDPIDATGPKATANQRQTITSGTGRCHHCGRILEEGEGIADHIPPTSLANNQQQLLYRQCDTCRSIQATALRWPAKYSPMLRKVDFYRPWRTYYDLRQVYEK